MSPRYDTPTDGISRKQFDRAMDSHIRRYAILAEELREIRTRVNRMEKLALAVLADAEDKDRA